MAASGTITLSGLIQTLLTGSKTIGPLTVTSANAVSKTDTFTLGVGATTITIPTGATAMIVVLDPANTGVITLKGIAADTGFQVLTTQPFMMTIAATQTTFVFNATISASVQIVWM